MTMPPGWRGIPDPEAEVRRLAGERAALETAPLPRRDLEILLAVATTVLDGPVPFPPGLTYADVEAVVKRHAGR
jgi:hypothetical protein